MKTLSEVNKEIIELHKQLVIADKENTKKSRKQFKRLNSKIVYLKKIALYLETNPRPEFIRKEIDAILMRIAGMDSGYILWCHGRQITAYKDPKKTYTNEMGLPAMEEQLKTLKYILD